MLQAAGGMDWMIQIAEKLLRSHPSSITFLAPICTFFLTVMVGTGHVVYTLMPIICDISLKQGIRPERPCGVASIASRVGITCSPIAAAVASFVTISNAAGFDISNLEVIGITIPACLCGLMAAAAASYKRGLDLDKDPQFQARCKDPETYKYMYGNNATLLDKEIGKEAKWSVYIFMGALALIVLFSLCQIAGCDIRPTFPAMKTSDIATVNFDRSGTTVIGKYLLNHSFMMPGLISVTVSCIVGYVLSMMIY